MNETLKEHVELKANGTMAGKRFLHLDEMNPNHNYAANTYLIALEELSVLREAGEKMAKQLRALRSFQVEIDMRGDSSIVDDVEFIFNSEDAAALEAWEAANK